MDIEKLKLKSLSLFKSFINDLIQVYPEHKNKIYEKYGDVLVGDNSDISKFLDSINKYEKLITNRNEKLFDDNIYIFENIPMSDLWKKDISESTKKNIWKYLQTFCVIHINLKSSESLKELLSGETNTLTSENKKDLKDLKKIKKMKNDMEEKKTLNDLNMEDMLNNSSIGKIAKEISESLDIPNIDSADDISKLFEGEGIMNLFNKVNSTVKQKLESGELNDDILKNEADNMYPNMMNNDMFKNMAETMSKFSQANNSPANNPPANNSPANNSPANNSPSNNSQVNGSNINININNNNLV
jgi:hypothetical protein